MSVKVRVWGVPVLQAAQLLGGNWEPYPIDMSFQPPCMVLSTIGLAQPGKIQMVSPCLTCLACLSIVFAPLPIDR